MTFDAGVAVGLLWAVLMALGAPLTLLFVLMRRGATFKAFAIGAGTFFVAQVMLRLPWQIPLGTWLKPAFEADGRLLWAWAGFSSMTAALFEEVGRWVAFARFQKRRTALEATMMGAGHGAMESVALVGFSLASNLVMYLMLTQGSNPGLTPEQVTMVELQFSKLTPLTASLAGFERIGAMMLHVGCSLLVAQRFVRNARRWLWSAVGCHAVVNLVGVSLTMAGLPLASTAAVVVLGCTVLLVAARASLPVAR